jgi:hypothetical protein
MATVLEGSTTEVQRSVLRFFFFLWEKGLNAKDIHKKCFLFTVGSVCRVKRFTTEWETFSLMTKLKRSCASGFDNSQKNSVLRFRSTDKAMEQVYQCCWRICREIHVFIGSNIICFYILHPFVTYLLTLNSYKFRFYKYV